jgi:bacteriorhodopsin
LGIVAIIGTALGIYQYYLFTKTHNMEESIDNLFNCLFGVILCIWSSVFVENWKKK